MRDSWKIMRKVTYVAVDVAGPGGELGLEALLNVAGGGSHGDPVAVLGNLDDLEVRVAGPGENSVEVGLGDTHKLGDLLVVQVVAEVGGLGVRDGVDLLGEISGVSGGKRDAHGQGRVAGDGEGLIELPHRRVLLGAGEFQTRHQGKAHNEGQSDSEHFYSKIQWEDNSDYRVLFVLLFGCVSLGCAFSLHERLL